MVEEERAVSLFGKLFVLIVLGSIVLVYVLLPYINGMTGPYRTVTYVTKEVVVPEENNDWKEQPLFDRNGNVIE
jgi:hypothetical protein